ncbi:MAG: helix-turn-helix transcriptional regulator, partial [Saprospiraceae bacterium]
NDRSKLFQLLAILRAEYERTDMFRRQATLELFGGMMLIIARNLHKKENLLPIRQSKEEEKVSTILTYIRQHILEKEKMKIKAIAEAHLMSPNYVSIFIKKHTGLSIQQLVMETKLKTSERLLRQSNLTVSEISNRLGFTDASHFTKTFKKHKGKNPSTVRR